MKVISIGRGPKCDVKLIDRKVSHMHCQIIQYDNGSFAIVDNNSSNGTFVNGIRVRGSMPLNLSDRVTIVQTDIQWQQYFSKSGKNKRLPIVLAFCGVIVIIAVVVLLGTSDNPDSGSGNSTGKGGLIEPRTEEHHYLNREEKPVQQIRSTKPNEAQIAADLVGNSLGEGKENGYYSEDWLWKIKEGEVSDLRIISVEENNASNYSVVVSMRLSSETRSFDCRAFVLYRYDNRYGWRIEMVQSKGMDIVKTHRYDNCISCEHNQGWLMSSVSVKNNCNIALEVGGNKYESSKWKKFSMVIPPNETKDIPNVYGVDDYQIDYVERP